MEKNVEVMFEALGKLQLQMVELTKANIAFGLRLVNLEKRTDLFTEEELEETNVGGTE